MATRADYLRYLVNNGFTEAEVLAMHDPKKVDREGAVAIGTMIGLMAKILRDHSSESDVKYARSNLRALTANTNHLLQEIINGRLVKRFRETGVAVPDGIFPGVFPINDFNAHAVRKPAGLILLDTACFEIIEAGAWIQECDDTLEVKAQRLLTVVEKLVVRRELPQPKELDHPSLRGPGTEARKIHLTAITTAAEEFVLAHEYGHFALDHYSKAGRNLEKFRIEFEADEWAMRSLMLPNSVWLDEDGLQEQIEGACLFIGLGALVDAIARDNGMSVATDYPTPAERFNRIALLLRDLGLVKESLPGLNLGIFLFATAEKCL